MWGEETSPEAAAAARAADRFTERSQKQNGRKVKLISYSYTYNSVKAQMYGQLISRILIFCMLISRILRCATLCVNFKLMETKP